jgi:transcriptional repressor of cell division inhibition gene dicB
MRMLLSMFKEDVVRHFGSATNAAKALDVSISAVSQWGKKRGDGLVPRGSAYKVQLITGGALRVDPALYPKRSSFHSKKPRKAACVPGLSVLKNA